MFHHMFRKCKINKSLFFFLTTFADFTQNLYEYQCYEVSLMRQFARFEHDKTLLMINETQN